MLKGVFQSSFTLRNNPKLTKSHVCRPVSRRGSGCAPVTVGLESSKPKLIVASFLNLIPLADEMLVVRACTPNTSFVMEYCLVLALLVS